MPTKEKAIRKPRAIHSADVIGYGPLNEHTDLKKIFDTRGMVQQF